jgi:hypothetical protein
MRIGLHPKNPPGDAMPRYYFDLLLHGDVEADGEGINLDGPAVARQEAVRAAAEFAKDLAHNHQQEDIAIRVRDEEGDRVATARLRLNVE